MISMEMEIMSKIIHAVIFLLFLDKKSNIIYYKYIFWHTFGIPHAYYRHTVFPKTFIDISIVFCCICIDYYTMRNLDYTLYIYISLFH